MFNVNNMSGIIDELEPFDKLQVEFRLQKVDNNPDSPKAAVIYCNWEKASKVRIALLKLYSPKNKESFLLGIQMSFIPHTDPRFIMTRRTRTQIKKMIQKQKLFLKNTGTIKSYNILGLDSPNSKLGDMTLHKCIM